VARRAETAALEVLLDRSPGGIVIFGDEFRSLPQLCLQRLPGLALFGNSV
jgi:hypothetical protein